MSYFENRYYIDAIGRFTQRDPVFKELGRTKRANNLLSDPQQWNAYSYARNNPVRFTDVTGEFIETAFDAWNVLYDLGRWIKNVWEIIGWWVAYWVWVYNKDEYLKQVAKNGIKSDLKDLWEVGVDLWSDSLAAAIPWVPAGGTKIARNIAKKADDVWRWTKEVIKYTSKQYANMAEKLGYKEVKWAYSNWEKIFYNSKTKKYISWDNTQHNWGVWKMADSVNWLKLKDTRSWTYDKDLNKIWR